jgi:putative membrane protein
VIELAFNNYNAFKFVHVLFAVIWVGGALTVQVYALLAVRTQDPVRIAAFARDTEFVGTRIFIPSSLILLVSGIFTIHESSGAWSFDQGWVQFGLVIILLSIAVGAGYLGPESGRIAKATDAHGVESPEVQARIQRIFLVSRIELVLLMLVVFDMVVKPGI